MKCEPQLSEQHAVEILLKNIRGPIAFLLKGFTIKTFEKLLTKASNLQADVPKFHFLREPSSVEPPRPKKPLDRKPGNVSAVDKGKAPMRVQFEKSIPQSPQKIQQSVGPLAKTFSARSLEDKLNQTYSFKREAVRKIFKNLMKKSDFQLPEPKRPVDASKANDPKYCHYHRLVGHTLEDYCVQGLVGEELKRWDDCTAKGVSHRSRTRVCEGSFR